MTQIVPSHDAPTLPPHTTNIVPSQAANILPPHTTNSVPPHDTTFGTVPLRQRVVTFTLPLMHSDPDVSVAVELTSIQPPTSGCTPVRSPPRSISIEFERLPRMNTTDSSAPPYHGPHTLKVGSANYAPELGTCSRTIRVYGSSVGAVDIGDDVPHKAVHVPLQVYHRSFQALADSGASVSCISAVTFDVLRRRCRDVSLVLSDKLLHTYDGKQSRCMGTTILPVTLGTLTVKVKLYIMRNLVSDFILGVNYLFALRATLDFDHEVIRLCHPTIGLRSTIGFTNRDRDRRQVDSVCALATVPLGPCEQRRVPARMPLDRVGRPGLLSMAGAVSMGSACVAYGYSGEVPATTSTFIANSTSEHVIVRAGTRVG
jgi:gag-polyprotein putative aspartyl protease